MQVIEGEMIIYVLAAIMLAAIFVLLSMANSYRRLLKKYQHLKIDEEDLKRHLDDKGMEAYEDARGEWYQLIREAHMKATRIVNEADLFTDEIRDDVAKAVEQSTKEELEEYKKTLDEARKEIEEVAQNITIDIKEGMMNEIRQSREIIDQEMLEYKKAQIAIINEKTQAIIQDIASEVLGKSLTLADHEDLVMKSIEKSLSHINKVNN